MLAITLAHTYNADEMGSQIGIGDAPLVIGLSELQEVLIENPINREWLETAERFSPWSSSEAKTSSKGQLCAPG